MRRIAAVSGVTLLILGIVGLVHPIFTYREKEEVAKIGPIKATIDTDKTFEISPFFSVPALLAGIGLILASPKFKN
jgi:hypothetical protein